MEFDTLILHVSVSKVGAIFNFIPTPRDMFGGRFGVVWDCFGTRNSGFASAKLLFWK